MKVFIQNIDRPVYGAIAQFFSESSVEMQEADSDVTPEFFQVVGSSSDASFVRPKHVQNTVDVKLMLTISLKESDKASLFEELMSCDIIVWDVFSDSADAVIAGLNAH